MRGHPGWAEEENGPMDARLGQRDLEALRWVGEQYACRLDQLQVLLGHLGGRVRQALVARYDSVWYFVAADCWVALHDAACHVPPQLADLVRIYALEDL